MVKDLDERVREAEYQQLWNVFLQSAFQHIDPAVPAAVLPPPCLIRRLKTNEVKKRQKKRKKQKRSPKRGKHARRIIYGRSENEV